jgi:ligand-binding SRPBCC domain-containing protein
LFNFANQDIIKMIHTQIKRAQIIKTDIDTLWEFMSSPNNLKKITPKRMSFNITSKNNNEAIYPDIYIKVIIM